MAKYDGVNPFDKLHPDEPWFFIRAQDKLSLGAVTEYGYALQREGNKAAKEGNNDLAMALYAQSNQIANFASEFEAWQINNADKVKLPD